MLRRESAQKIERPRNVAVLSSGWRKAIVEIRWQSSL